MVNRWIKSVTALRWIDFKKVDLLKLALGRRGIGVVLMQGPRRPAAGLVKRFPYQQLCRGHVADHHIFALAALLPLFPRTLYVASAAEYAQHNLLPSGLLSEPLAVGES